MSAWAPQDVVNLVVAIGGIVGILVPILLAVLTRLLYKVQQIETNTNSLVTKVEAGAKLIGKAEEQADQKERDESFAAGRAAGPPGQPVATGTPAGPMVVKAVEIEAEIVKVAPVPKK